MTGYIGILENESGSLWGMWFPDLPGCVSAGETADAVLAQAGDALEQWIECAKDEGQAIPPARSLGELRRLEEVSEALKRGDAAVLVVPTADALGLSEEAVRALDDAAARTGVSRVDFLRRAVLDKLAS